MSASAFDPTLAVKLGKFIVQIADWDPEVSPGPVTPPFNYKLLHFLIANDLIPGLSDFDIYGYLALSADGSDLVVALRGTNGVLEWLKDFQFGLVAYPDVPGAGRTASGFASLYASLGITKGNTGPDIVPDPTSPHIREVLRALLAGTTIKTLHITGHSLGGALGTLLALDLVGNGVFAAPTVYTFASPAVGDKKFAGTYDSRVPNTWRIANPADIITHVPLPIMGFVHVDREYLLHPGHEPLLHPECQHHMQTYLHALDPTVPKFKGC